MVEEPLLGEMRMDSKGKSLGINAEPQGFSCFYDTILDTNPLYP
jgi:hypothetical protein